MGFTDIQGNVAGMVYDVPGEFYPRETLKKLHPERYKELKAEYSIRDAKLIELFKQDLRGAVEEDLNKKLTDLQWKAIWNYVWEEGHSGGYHEIVNVTIGLMGILKTFYHKEKRRTL